MSEKQPLAGRGREDGGAPLTLAIRKVGSERQRLLTLGGEAHRWAVTDGGTVLATAGSSLANDNLDIEVDGRRLTLRLPRRGWFTPPSSCEVVDDQTGRQVANATMVSGGRTRRNQISEEWKVTLASGATLSWIYRRADDVLGFYQPQGGAPVLRIGHDPSFDAPANASVLRILLRFWFAAAASADRYLVRVEPGVIGHLVPSDDLPVVALFALWMERTADRRYPSASAGAG